MTPGDSTPTPDPTILTTEQIQREISNTKDLLQSEITCLERETMEKLRSVETQFKLIERQRVEQKGDTEKAVAAALAAAKEAVQEQTDASDKSITKSETATAEQLKQLNVTISTAISGVADSLGDLKERVGAIESAKQGAAENRSNANANVGLWILGGGFVLTGLGLLLTVVLAANGVL